MTTTVIVRRPGPALRPFVSLIWTSGGPDAPRPAAMARERVLPAGEMHIAIRLSDQPVRIFRDLSDPAGEAIGHAVAGGARAGFYLRDTAANGRVVGAQIRPGAAEVLLGISASDLAARHAPLECLWGGAAPATRDRLAETPDPGRCLAVLESCLAARLPATRALHPAVAHALARLDATSDVGAVVRETGCSHRRFVQLFRRAVGLSPKVYCRLLRFRLALRRMREQPGAPLAGIALDTGYSDQAHFSREFREFAGVTPAAYRRIAPASAHHVRVS